MEPGLILICLVLITSATVSGQPVGLNATDTYDNVDAGGFLPFKLTYSPVKVFPGITNNVELRCARDEKGRSSIKELVWMRILKYSNTPGPLWKVVAEQRGGRSQTDGYGEMNSYSRITPVEHSYLSVVWSKPIDDMFGSYKCLILGIDQHLSFVVDETPKVRIKAKKISESALLDAILETEVNIRDKINNNSREISDTASRMDAFTQRLEQNFSAASDRLDKANLTVESIMTNFLFPRAQEVWPAGTYALLKPESGCPANMAFYKGSTGYFRFHTESSSVMPDNGYSKNSHMSKPIITSYSVNTFMTLRFCVTNGVYNSGAWPDGRYCIHQKDDCPDGFKDGYINFKTESWGNMDKSGGNIPDSEPSKLHFCCRTSGSPTTPIVLPTAHPFYLYQYDGRCQQVKGMKVTQEYVQMDTEAGSDGIKDTPYLPPGSSGDIVRLELCYYTKY